MVNSFTAYTHEVDDVDLAVSEILQQLDLGGKNKLQKNTVGIISCFAEYMDSGVWKALCEQLPFEVVGTTTIANMTAGEIGETMLGLLVLTSDDCIFAAALSDPIKEENTAQLKALYDEALKKLPGKPSMMLSFAPLLNNFGFDFYVECMEEISGNVPNFGALAVDHHDDYHDASVLLNGERWMDRLAVLLIYGPIDPVFYVGTISDEKVFSEKGVVTASVGNQLQMVNGVSVLDYLQSLGLTRNEAGTITGINAFPIIVDYNDGTMPVARAMFAVTPEGHAVCGGNIPVGSTLSIGFFDSEEIISTTCRAATQALSQKNCRTMLMYSCIGRFFAQGYEPMGEFQKLQTYVNQSNVVHLTAYSGGELCPVYNKEGKTVNRNHNNSFIICAF